MVAIELFHCRCSAQGSVLWKEDFESPAVFDNWHFEGGTWEIGKPSSGPGKAFQGTNCAATVLDGNYTPSVDARLIRDTRFVVPSASENPRLTFWHWFNNYLEDPATVQIRVAGGEWKTISPSFRWGSPWTRASLDLREYAGQMVQIAFRFQSNGDALASYGWYVDEVEVVTGPYRIDLINHPETFEAGLGDWYSDNGTWQVGIPTTGPEKAHEGRNCAGTALNANYDGYVDSRLVSPVFSLACAEANPRLRFWHWYSIGGGDQGTVEIREIGSDWQPLVGPFKNTSGGVWTTGFLNLAPFAGKAIQLAFHFQSNSDSSVDAGWYVDDVKVQSDALVPVGDKTVDEERLLSFTVTAKCSNGRYSLGPDAPDGAAIDPDLGVFTWIPKECAGPGSFPITINLAAPNDPRAVIGFETITVTVNEVNSLPVLDLIENKAVRAGVALTFPATAYDPDCPTPQNLCFSLDEGAPIGAAIDCKTGLFAWTATAEQASNKRSITVRVTDNGSPPLSSTVTFVAVPDAVETRLSATRGTGSLVRLVIDGGSVGSDYTIQVTSVLKLPPATNTWSTLGVVRPGKLPFIFDDPEASTAPIRFYRVLRSP